MDIGAEEDHPAVFHVLLHGPSEAALCFLGQLVRLIDHQHFEGLATLRLDIGVPGDLFDNVLDDVPVVVVVIGRSHLDMVVACEQRELNRSRRRLGLKHSFFLLKLEDMVSKYFGQKGVSSGFFAGSFGAVHDDVLG